MNPGPVIMKDPKEALIKRIQNLKTRIRLQGTVDAAPVRARDVAALQEEAAKYVDRSVRVQIELASMLGAWRRLAAARRVVDIAATAERIANVAK